MRNYSKVGGQKGKPGYRTPKFFLNKFIALASKGSKTELYQNVKTKIKGYFSKPQKDVIEKKEK